MGLINLSKKLALNRLIGQAIEHPARFADVQWWQHVYTTAWGIKEIRIMFERLQGYKTYLVAALTAAVYVLHALGKIDSATRDTLIGLLASGGIATVAAKINRLGK